MKKTPHRFFRAMVVMSSGVALGCGGMSSSDRNDDPSPDGGSGAGSGGSPGGATSTAGSGGRSDSGTAGGISLGGSAGAPVVDPGPFPCAPAQWDCSGVQQVCSYSTQGYDLPEGCACDGERPTEAADCEQGESLVCRNATIFNDGMMLQQPIPFECSCVPSGDYCRQTCQEAFPELYDSSCTQDTNPILCGCAVIVLK